MNKQNEHNDDIIMKNSDRAAHLETLSLWVDRLGYIYKDEASARYAGCTHTLCSCGTVIPKTRVYCDVCKIAIDKAHFLAMPYSKWDGKTPVCLFRTDQYFFNMEEIEEFCEEKNIQLQDLNFCICKPVHVKTLEDDFFEDYISEDSELPLQLQEAMEDFNKKINEYNKIPTCWEQGHFRTSIMKGLK